MKVGVPTETGERERRVALVPEVVKRLVAKGHEVSVQPGAGAGARLPDALFEEAGARMSDDVWSGDLVAKTTGYDVRPEVAEQVKSLGADFLDLGISAAGEGGYARELTQEERAEQQQALTDAIKGFDVVVTTAAVPGRPAPKLVLAEAVEGMRPGSIVVDLAAETGGNCELTEPGETVVAHDVTIIGPLNLPSQMPEHASMLYARNVQSLLELLEGEAGALNLDFEDEVIAGACVVRDGEIVHPGAKQA